MTPRLSVLVPMVPRRLASGVSTALIAELCRQAENQPVEILGLLDNKRRTLGAKRNDLLQMARGDYVAFVGDDDWVNSCYVELLLERIENAPDLITFQVFVSGGGVDSVVDLYESPRDICAWNRSLVRNLRFPEVSAGEDGAWAQAAHKRVTFQAHVPHPLYYQRVNPQTSETSKGSPCARDTIFREATRHRRR